MKFLFLLSLLLPGLLAAKDSKPNFVFLLVDDLGLGDFGCYGAKFYETPHIDKLAADGMLFYKGFFLVLLGIRSMVANAASEVGPGAAQTDRWNQPFEMIRDGHENTFEWTHSGIAEHLCQQWLAAPIGCH